MEALCTEYNNVQKGAIQEDWLYSYLISLPEPRNDTSQIYGYRVIAMQNTIGKLLEKIVTRKAAYELERQCILPATLGSYR